MQIKYSDPLAPRRPAAPLLLLLGAGLLLGATGCGKSQEGRDLDGATGNAGRAVAKTHAQQGEREKRIGDATAVLDGK